MKFFIVSLALVAVAAAAQQPPVAILRQSSDIHPEGTYSYSFEAENGISAGVQGSVKAVRKEGPLFAVQGEYKYTADDGTPILVRYVADENGFQPQGDHLPVAHPIPEYIQRSIEYNLAHPQKEDEH